MAPSQSAESKMAANKTTPTKDEDKRFIFVNQSEVYSSKKSKIAYNIKENEV